MTQRGLWGRTEISSLHGTRFGGMSPNFVNTLWRDRGTHTLIRMDERNSLTKIRLISSGFTPVLFAHKEMGFSWMQQRCCQPTFSAGRSQTPSLEIRYLSLEF